MKNIKFDQKKKRKCTRNEKIFKVEVLKKTCTLQTNKMERIMTQNSHVNDEHCTYVRYLGCRGMCEAMWRNITEQCCEDLRSP